MSVTSIVILILVVVTFFYCVAVYNKLVALRNRFQNGFAQIEVQLKRRHDLIPNLVETAKTYLKHERETLEAIVQARNTAVSGLQTAAQQPGDANAIAGLANAENLLSSALGKLHVVVENYPDLKADSTMRQLSEELTSTENKVAFARQAFNDFVTDYNSYRQQFPPVVLAGMFGHGSDAQLLEFADSAAIQAAPTVSF